MSKRSSFRRRERDNYPTPETALPPLLRHLEPGTRFIEPCCGEGLLARHLVAAGYTCSGEFDLPERDATSARYDDVDPAAIFITNPPWDRKVFHPALINLSDQRPCWLLVDTSWIFTQRAVPCLPRLRHIVSVRRLKWIPDSPHQAMDDCCWLHFDRLRSDAESPRFHDRIDTRTSRKRRAA
jgi:hypothetical protein